MVRKKKGVKPIVSNEVDVLADQIGNFIQYWGFRKIEGRLWTYIFLSKRPLKAGELMAHTKISKAMFSLAVNELLKYDVIEKAFPSKERGQAYRPNLNVMEVINNVFKAREKRMIVKIESSYQSVKKNKRTTQAENLNRERLLFLGEMISSANLLLDSFVAMQPIDGSLFKLIQQAPEIAEVKSPL